MKRIYSLVCAMMMALSAFAQQETPLLRPQATATEKPLSAFSLVEKTADKAVSSLSETLTEMATVGAIVPNYAPAAAVDTVQIKCDILSNCYRSAYDGNWFVAFRSLIEYSEDQYTFRFKFINGDSISPVGTYTSLDQLVFPTSWANLDKDIESLYDSIKYTAIDLVMEEDEDGALWLHGTVNGTTCNTNKSRVFVLDCHNPAPLRPKATLDINMEASLEKSYIDFYDYTFAGTDSVTGYYVQMCPSVDMAKIFANPGQAFTIDKYYIDWTYTGIFDLSSGAPKTVAGIMEWDAAKSSIMMTPEREFHLHCNFLGTDTVQYNIYMTLQLPEYTEEPIDIKITNAGYMPMMGSFQMSGYNLEYQAVVSGPDKVGVPEDLASYSAMVAKKGEDDKWLVARALFFSAAELSMDEAGNAVVTCAFYANDYKEYTLDMRLIIGDPVDTLVLNDFNDCEYKNGLDKYQQQIIEGVNESGDYEVGIHIFNTTEVAGEFEIGVDADGFIYDLNTDKQLSFMDGTVTITMDENMHITCHISANAMDIDVHHYELTLHAEWDSEYLVPIAYDATEGELNASFYLTDNLVEESYLSDGYLYFKVSNIERGEALALAIYTPKKDKDIFIPEGTYPIEEGEDTYRVQACPGVWDGVIYPSYYVHLDSEGSIVTPIWALVRGTMTVKKVNNELTFVIDAINSYKRPIHITFNCDDTALPSTSATEGATKRFENGQIVIYKNNKRYTTLGQEL